MNGVYLADPEPDYGEDDGEDEPVAKAVPPPTRRYTEPHQQYQQQQYPAPTPKYPPRPSQVTQAPQRRSAVAGPISGAPAAGPVVKPPDRYQQAIEQNTSRANQQQLAKGNDKLPRKHIRSTKTHLVDKSLLDQLELIHSSGLRVGTSLTSDPRQSRISVFNPTPITMPLSRTQQPQSDVIQKRSQSEKNAIYDQIRTSNVLQPIPDRRRTVFQGSIRSADEGYNGSTISSRSSMPHTSSDPSLMVMPNCEYDEWALRWCLDKVGKAPGQLRSPKGVCVLRNSGNVIVADTKNARLQMFSGSSGKLISVLGAESWDQRIANTFYDVSQRRMEPCGLCETTDGSLLVVTDLNRVLYVDAESKHGGLQGSLPLPGKTHLSGVAITQNNKLILSEVGSSKPSVGLYENNGTLITAFKGDFRSPSYIAWNEELKIAAVSDGEQQCVLLYDASGKLLNKLGHQVLPLSTSTYPPSGPTSSALVYPAGICWLGTNRLLVADRSEHRVVVIDVRNSSIEDILTDAVGGLKHPVAIATNRRNRIVLTEEFYDFGVNESRLKMYRLMTSSQF